MATQITTAYRFHRLERETIVLNQPKLNPPTIRINGEKMTITDGNNGSFTEGFKVYANGGYLLFSDTNVVDFSRVEFPEGFLDGLISASCTGTFFNDSNESEGSILKLKGYILTDNDFGGDTASLYTTYQLKETDPVFKRNVECMYLD